MIYYPLQQGGALSRRQKIFAHFVSIGFDNLGNFSARPAR